MKYLGQASDFDQRTDTIGVLLTNLGTPDRAVCPGLRKYLSEFLMDPRVIEVPALLRWLLVKGIIINVRSHKSAATYREIWTENGSPLLLNSEALGEKLGVILGEDYKVAVAMRYGNPSIADKLADLHHDGVRKLIVIPMYPQYSGSTAGSTFDALGSALKKRRWVPSLSFIDSYYQRPAYIAAIGDSIKAHWQQHGRAEKLLMSFHGVPKKYIERGDPYQQQCCDTAQQIAAYLGLADSEWLLVFQSRFGAEEWLQPYCDETLKTLPRDGVKSVDIICPGFSVDCLETLEEIEGENRQYFIDAGGQEYNYIPCLNASDGHAQLMAEIVHEQQLL
ncbi:MAG: ferrochelatase [Arenicella sp.]|nr:ferrochelatase [Arenicella sp.]